MKSDRIIPVWAQALAVLTGASFWLLLPVVETAGLWIGTVVLLLLVVAGLSGRLPAVGWLLAGLLAGLVWSGWNMWQQHQLLRYESREILTGSRQQTLSGRVLGLPRQEADGLRFVFETSERPARYYLLRWYQAEQRPRAGESWRLQVKLKPPHGYANPGGFDYSRWLFRHRFVATGWVQSGQRTGQPSVWDMAARIHQWRASVRQWLQETVAPGASRALLLALSIGDRSELTPKDQRIFQATGTAHVIAISGLHIGLAALLGVAAGWLVFWFWPQTHIPRPVLQAVLGWLSALLYAALAGFSVATVRALVAVSVFAVAVIVRRRLSPWDIWGVALLLVLAVDPLAVLDAGFWLSFAAVAALLAAFYRPGAHDDTPLVPNAGKIRRGLHWLGQLTRAQLAIGLGLLPLSILVFHELHWLAPLVNLVVIPLISVSLVPLLGFALLFYAIPGTAGLAEGLLSLADGLARNLITFLNQLAGWPATTYPVATPPLWWFGIWFMGLGLWFFAWGRTRKTTGVLLLAALLMLLLWRPLWLLDQGKPLTAGTNSSVSDTAITGAFRISVLDVGQGLSVLVETTNHRLLYDTGAAFDSGFNLADAVLLPYFRYRGIRALDVMVLSHRDNDHAGAVEHLLAGMPVDRVYATFPLPEMNALCVHGLKWHWDSVEFEVLSPYNVQPYLGNNSSCVLRVGSRFGHVLLTGDIESPVEYRLLQAHKAGELSIESDVLLVPHHGSATSSSEAFLDVVEPKLAINASGFLNAFGHPKAAVVARYRQRGIDWLDTQASGLITVSFTAAGRQVSEYRRQQPARVWHLPAAAGQAD